MADRPEVKTANAIETALTLTELGTRMAATLATLPLHQPWTGPESVVDNTVHESVREILKTLLTYSLSLPTPRLRSLEKVLDDLCRTVLRPVATRDGVTIEDAEVNGIPGVWVRPPHRPRATILYLHGGGYLATTPWMYSLITAELVRTTGCDLFIADYRLAPEFPFPAGLFDAMQVFEGLLDDGRSPDELFVAGDSGGGGLATSLFEDVRTDHLPEPAGAILFSPEVDLVMGERSVKANARHDVLPDQIPVLPYLAGADPHDPRVSAVYADVHNFPPTFVAYGDMEMFRDEIVEFIGELQDADVEVQAFEAPFLFHVYEILMPWATQSKATIAAVSEFVDQQLRPGGSRGGDSATAPLLSDSMADGADELDVVVVGAGFAGMYLLHRLRGLGFSARVIEAGDDVGGTWYWNRYPGARCDIQSIDYSYAFDAELDETWVWSEKYAPQPEILSYARHVADRFDLRRDIEFGTRVESAAWDDATSRWRVRTSKGEELTCSYYVMATGCLSVPKEIDIEGTDRFAGEVYFTSRWPHEAVDLAGKRVAVIGTGSSAIQSIPIIAEQAGHVTVLQRTPNFAMPANNGPVPESKAAAIKRGRAEYRESARQSGAGVPIEVPTQSALAVSVEERLDTFERVWNTGGIIDVSTAYIDTLVNPAANELLADFAREKIRAVVDDPETAEMLCPYDYPIGAKRLCVETGYYETFNRDNVRLVDLRRHAIKTITEHGIELADEKLEFDVLVFATGFDAMTGALVNVDIAGRNGLPLKEAWSRGPMTYLGLMVAGFPNLFMVTGPGSPSVLSNMMVSIEQHVDWISDCIKGMRDGEFATIEPTPLAVEGWVTHVNDYGAITLYPQANSWYMGANVPGKPRVFLPYCGGVDRYRRVCDEVVSRGYLGFVRRQRDGVVECVDGVVRRVQPDVAILLEMLEQVGVPPIDALAPPEARALMTAMDSQRPPGPEVGEIVDATLPGPSGDLRYRLYRPATAGPHPIVAYFHGGGWVLGSEVSDAPLCRELCSGSDAIVVSVDYRHAPESTFPAPVDDAFAAVKWIAANAAALGGIEGELAVAGWSAGGNLAAVVCHLARDSGGPSIAGQLLINPVVDGTMSQPSYSENAEGYLLTKSLMEWFWDHYSTPDDRRDPRASPLEAESLADLPPAFIVTSEFDPLRDEGAAYARALGDAGVTTEHLACRGQIHTSLVAVDLIASSAGARAAMAEATRAFFA